MSGFIKCVIYLAVLGILSNFVGRIIAALKPDYTKRPFTPLGFEQNGAFYEKLGIRHWKDRVPDMSKLLRHLLPKKEITERPTAASMETLLRETCVAECVHVSLSVLSLACLLLWKGAGGLCLVIVYILLGNLPFIMIQRYNRPKLARVHERLVKKEQRSKNL